MEQEECSFGTEPSLDVFGVAMDDLSRRELFRLVDALRKVGVSADMDYGKRSMKAQMKTASSRKARFACIIGERELDAGTVVVKNLQDGEQWEIPASDAPSEIRTQLLSTLKG